jgi:thiol-disulfide isomerase/thioredoxin
MPSIVDSLYKDFIKPYYYQVFIVFLLVLFSLATYYAYTQFYMPKAKIDTLGKDVANANMRHKEAQLMFFYADWCPHCRNAKPIWEDEKAKYADTLVNNYKVVFVNVDCSDDADPHTQALIQEYNIKGFPTLKMVYSKEDGTPLTVDFDAKITKYSLDQFIETVLNQSN